MGDTSWYVLILLMTCDHDVASEILNKLHASTGVQRAHLVLAAGALLLLVLSFVGPSNGWTGYEL